MEPDTPEALDWAPHFTPAQGQQFLSDVSTELQRRKMPHEVVDTGVFVTKSDGETQTWGLGNLAKICGTCEPDHWPAVIREHFDNISRIKQDDISGQVRNYHDVKKLLKIILQPGEYIQTAEKSVCREVAEGVVASLVYDFPQYTATVLRSRVDNWDIGKDDLFEIALENTIRDHPLELQELDVEGVKLSIVRTDHFFAASHALHLAPFVPSDCPHGVLLGIPIQYSLFMHTIRDLSAVDAIMKMLRLVRGINENEPRPVSDQLYWWNDGNLTIIPSKVRNNQLELSPSAEFIETLNKLKAPK